MVQVNTCIRQNITKPCLHVHSFMCHVSTGTGKRVPLERGGPSTPSLNLSPKSLSVFGHRCGHVERTHLSKLEKSDVARYVRYLDPLRYIDLLSAEQNGTKTCPRHKVIPSAISSKVSVSLSFNSFLSCTLAAHFNQDQSGMTVAYTTRTKKHNNSA